MSMNRRMNELSADDPGVKGLVLTGGALTPDPNGRYVIISTAGNIVGKLLDDTADITYVLPVGVHKLAFKSVTTSTAVGVIVA